MTSTPFRDAAADLAAAGWPVFPCHGKEPLTPHGHHDGTTDPARIGAWIRRYPQANIGCRVPDSLLVVDIDPRNGAGDTLQLLKIAHGELPATLTSRTGGGGTHRFHIRPPGPLRNGAHKIGPGVDVKLGGKGYVILPPSIHPVTGQAYRWEDTATPIAALPAWLTVLLRPEPPKPRPPRPSIQIDTDRPGDELANRVDWADILEPAGWRLSHTRGDVRYWTRPGKNEGISATTNGTGTDRLYVFTSSAAPFEPDTSYSKFAAWTLINAQGNYSEAARLLRKGAPA